MIRLLAVIMIFLLNFGGINMQGVQVGGAKYVAPPVADYVPATVGIYVSDGGYGATLAVVSLYTDDGNTLLGTSAAFAVNGSAGWKEGSFSGMSALTPSNYYRVALLPNSNYIRVKGSTGGYKGNRKSATYPTPNSDLSSPAGQEFDHFHFYIKNAGGDTLLSETTGTTNFNRDGNYQHFKDAGYYACETL